MGNQRKDLILGSVISEEGIGGITLPDYGLKMVAAVIKWRIQRRWNARDGLGIPNPAKKQCFHHFAGALFICLLPSIGFPLFYEILKLAAPLSLITIS